MSKNKNSKILIKNLSFSNCTSTSNNFRNINSSQTKKGNMISYGCLNLTLTLELNEKDLAQNNISWTNLKNYDSLSFIKTNKSLWSRIKLSSTNSTLSTFLYINKIFKSKIKIKHICFRKIKFQQNQIDFKELIDSVSNSNGLILDCHSICPCELSIQLRLRYNGKRRLFVLSGEKTPLDDDDDEEDDYDMKEEDNVLLEEGANYEEIPNYDNMNGVLDIFDIDEKKNDDKYNPFIDIPKEINNVNDYYFIYFNYEDYNGDIENTFRGKITIKYLYDYFIYLKKNFRNNKIVLNMGSEIPKLNMEVKDLLTITNIAIFYDKNKLFQILNNFRNEEEKIKREEEYFKHYYDNKLKKEEIQQYLEEEDKRANLIDYLKRRFSEKIILKRNSKNSTLKEENEMPLFRRTKYNKNLYSLKLKRIKTKKCGIEEQKNKDKEKILKIEDNKYYVPLTKVEIFNYYKSEICEKDLLMKPNEEKMIIVLDELSKLYIVQFNKNYEKPFVFDLDIKLYEQINVHNINTIQSYKKIIKSNLEKYTILYIGYLLSALIIYTSNENKVSEEVALFIGYYSGQKILKKIIKMEKEEFDIPQNDQFYMPNLSNEEINDLIQQAEKRKREIKFILDGNNKNIAKLKLYNPLLDKYALSYLNKDKNKDYFKNKGFITEQGKLLYDPVYRESLLVNKHEKKVKNEKDLIASCREFKNKNNFKMKEIECVDNYKNIKEKLNKFIVGFKLKKPEYIIYLKESHNPLLPAIKKNTTYSSKFSSPLKNKTSVNFKMKSVKKKLTINI